MLHLPARFATVILPFATMFMQQRTWRHAQLLLLGALLTPGQRTICAILRMVGLRWERHFVTYHRVLNRAAWRDRVGTRLLFDLLVARFAPHGPVLLGVDDTIERRRGKRISAKGIYRDPVRSSKSFFVKTSGLRWLSLMLLAPSERYCRIRGLRHKTLTDWARQVALRARRWLPGREIILVGDSRFAALDLLAALRHHGMVCVTRLRLDAALYEPAPPRKPGTKGRAAQEGHPPAHTRPGAGGPCHELADSQRHQLVWHARAAPRDLLANRGVVPQRLATRAAPLGASARSRGTVRPAGSPVHRS